MDTMKFVELAKSKDAGRYNMNSIYRDKDRLIATDGFRLHYISGLPMVEKGHFIDGIDAEFPNYEKVFLKDPTVVATIKLDKKSIRDLAALAKVTKERCCGCRITVEPGQPLKFEADFQNETGSGSWSYTCDATLESSVSWSRSINLRYFLDAIVEGADVEIRSGADRGSAMEFVSRTRTGRYYHAIVMPIRED